MRAITKLEPVQVEVLPDRLEAGKLYISQRFSTAAHLCCCGCGSEVVTPLKPAKWQLLDDGGRVSLTPSVGNWSLPCQSHYWIVRGDVRWAEAFSPEMIQRVQRRDLADAIHVSDDQVTIWTRVGRWLRSHAQGVADWLRFR